MITINDFDKKVAEVHSRFNTLMAEFDSIKPEEVKNFDFSSFNALVFSFNEAYNILDRGLSGKFSFDE